MVASTISWMAPPLMSAEPRTVTFCPATATDALKEPRKAAVGAGSTRWPQVWPAAT